MIPENHYATRKPKYDHRSFLYVGHTHFLVEETGEIKSRTDLPSYLLTFTGRNFPLICCNDASGIVKMLDDALSQVSNWTWRATPLRRTKRSAAKPPEARSAVSVHLNPMYCGFRRTSGHGTNRYFHFVDCTQITGNTSQYHYSGLNEIESLRTFGGRYRDFCRDNGIAVASARGKVGGSFLRDPRFFGESVRHIPAHINAAARESLPGNHYELYAEENKPLEGLYLDITSAHHDAAARTSFPDPSGLRARGKRLIANVPGQENLPRTIPGGESWARSGTRKYDAVRRTHGMVLLSALYGGTPKGSILHPAARTATTRGSNHIYAYTNELDLIESSGFTITGIEAAWTSTRTSDSLNRYAAYAMETLQSTPAEDKPWVKSLFLSTYGMLGKRPAKYQSVSNMGGSEYKWPTPEGWIDGGIKQTSREHSPATTNVVALGMIQAETRRNVIETARYLQSYGVTILALYADSIIVDSEQLPLLPPEWRVKTPLTNLRFINRVSWVSDQEERLPGVSRDEALRESRRAAIRARASTDVHGPHGEYVRTTRFEPHEWVHTLNEHQGRGPSNRAKSRQFESSTVVEDRQVRLLRSNTT